MRLILLSILSFILFISCEGILNLDLIGDGNRIEQRRRVSFFSEVELNGDFILEIYQSTNNELFVEADANLLPYIQTTVTRERLEIRRKDNFNLIPRKPIRIRLYTNGFEYLENSEGGSVIIDTMSLEVFTVRNIGISQMVARSLNVESFTCTSENGAYTKIYGNFIELNLRQIGSGETFLCGSANNAVLVQEGSGSVNAYKLEALNAVVTLFGSGLIFCHIKDYLNATIKGIGRIYFRGVPILESSIDGGGLIIRED